MFRFYPCSWKKNRMFQTYGKFTGFGIRDEFYNFYEHFCISSCWFNSIFYHITFEKIEKPIKHGDFTISIFQNEFASLEQHMIKISTCF